MALIGTLRSKMGAWVVIFVFVAIAAFILGDLFSNKYSLFTRDSVGEIAGNSISLKEYQEALKEQEVNYSVQFNKSPGEREKALLENQAWEILILRNAIQEEYDKLGVTVTTEEVWDMLQGKNIDEGLKSAPIFQNEGGQFDKDKLVAFLKKIKEEDPATSEERYRWELYQKNIAPGRERIKYENLLIKSAYVTKAEAEHEYHLQNDIAEIKYVHVPYYAISDSSAIITDDDFQKYYTKNKEKYKSEFTRSIGVVAFPVVPSSTDSLDYRERLQQLADDFKSATNDSTFATGASDKQEEAYAKYTPSNIPPYLNADNLVKGNVIGPFIDANAYKLVKVSDVVPVAQARHILIKWAAETPLAKIEARERATKTLNEIRGGADFATKAKEVSEDQGSAQNGGDLGWFAQGIMVKPFNDAIFNATKKGLVNNLVESQFGYHIIDVTNVKENKGYAVATIQYEILPTDASINEALRKAENFQSGLSGVDEFRERAKAEKLGVADVNDLKTGDRRVGMLGEARQIVRWAFADASIGDVSTVFDLNDQFAVVVVTSEQKKGYKSIDQVREEIRPAVRNEVKARMIIGRLKDSKGTLEEVAKAFGTDAAVNTSNDLKLSTNSLPVAGFDPPAIGVAYSLENGKRSAPFAGENGVIIIELGNKTVAASVGDYSVYKTQIEQTERTRNFNIAEAIKEKSNIEDTRYRYY